MLFLKGTFGEVQLATYGIIFQWTALVYMVRIKLFLACISATPGKKKFRESIRVSVAVDNHVPLHKLSLKCLLHLKIVLWHNLQSLQPSLDQVVWIRSPYMGCIGMCGPDGYGSSAIRVMNRVLILADFGHKLGMVFVL